MGSRRIVSLYYGVDDYSRSDLRSQLREKRLMLPCKSILDAYEKSLDELISKRELVSDRLFPKTENISDALRWEKYHTLTQKCRIENEPCSNCQYYYGKHDIVCAVHTFGYEGDSCKDVEPN